MSVDDMNSTPAWRCRAFRVATFVALPFVALQVCFITNLDFWSVAFVYGILEVAVGGLFLGIVAFLILEWRWRRRLQTLFHRIPWFALAGAIALLLFFSFGTWARSVLLAVPSWCRASQVVEWSTTSGDEGAGHSFVLRLIGSGTPHDYRFSFGYLNWTGPGSADLTGIRLDPIKLQHDYYEEYHDGSLGALRERIGNSGLQVREVDAIAAQIWGALKQAEQGAPIKVKGAKVGAVTSGPEANHDLILGGLAWIMVVLLVFQILGQVTLGPAINGYRMERSQPA